MRIRLYMQPTSGHASEVFIVHELNIESKMDPYTAAIQMAMKHYE